MRVKSVPRHLPRKDGIPGLSRAKNASSELFAADKKTDDKYSPLHVKTVNFTNYQDMLQGMNLVTRQQIPIKSSIAFEKWRPMMPTNSDIGTAVDLSMKSSAKKSSTSAELVDNNNNNNNKSKNNNTSSSNNEFKGTCLYQIMTDPQLLSKIGRNREKKTLPPPPTPSTPSAAAASPSSSSSSSSSTQPKKPSPCPYCKRAFASEADLKRHLNVQADESTSQLSCCACGKSFAQKRYLRYHQRCHSERNKFACELCTRKYSRLDNLTRHNIFHTNPDKFPCSYCERTFARKDLLNKHLKCHENKYKYHCLACRKYFKGPVSLENHMKTFRHSASAGDGQSNDYDSASFGSSSQNASATVGRAGKSKQ